MVEYQFVDLRTDERLAKIVAEGKSIGVDTEFIREKTFNAVLCLVQVATGNIIYCADPMGLDRESNERVQDLWQKLTTPEWVVHSGRQDLEVIYQTAGRLPAAIFDTQVAAGLLGFQPQIGYGNLVRELFDVELAKSHTRADWSQRPLPEMLAEYAAEDVQYLLPARNWLTEKLDKSGRLDWAIEDSTGLLDPDLYTNDPSLAIERLKGARNLRGVARSTAVRLAAWRERQAMQRNRPRQWIMRDAVLLDIAVKRPDSRKKLGKTPGLSPKTLARAGDQLLEAVAAAGSDTTDYEPPKKPTGSQAVILKKMQQLVADIAKDLGLASELIAPKKELSAVLLGERELRILRGWRRELVGERILHLLEHG